MKQLLLACILLFSSVAIAQESEKETPEDKILIPVKLEENKEIQVEAKLSNLKPEAHALGLDELTLQGTKAVEPKNGQEEVKIVWNKAYIIKEDGEKKITDLNTELYSDLIAQPSLEKGDEFTAEGSLETLLLALQKLKEEQQEEEIKTEENRQIQQTLPTASALNQAEQEEPRELGFKTPDFTANPDPIIISTSDGCEINVDIAQMVAIVQERVLQDGEEIAPCSDTLTRYPITQNDGVCPIFVDIDALKAFPQFTLSYTNPEDGGDIQVQGCTADEDAVLTIIEKAEGCAIRHNFAQGLSYQQTQLVYHTEGQDVVVRGCEDSELSYAHIQTEETCSPIVDESAGYVIFQYRDKINVDGVDQYINDCTPNSSSQVLIQEEVCTSPRYTHDFDTGQSYLNKSYYYTNQQGERVDISPCQVSDVVFEHKHDETVCTPSHNDTLKETTLFAQTYIEEEQASPVYISTCQSILPTIPYVEIGTGSWQIEETYNNQQLTPRSSESQILSLKVSAPMSFVPPTNWSGPVNSSGNVYVTDPEGYKYYYGSSTPVFLKGEDWCLSYKELLKPWQWSGKDISIEYSDQPYSYTRTRKLVYYNGYSCSYNASGKQYSCAMTKGGVEHVCSLPTCNITKLGKNPTYMRGDGSSYVDTSTISAELYVCGDGSALVGQGN